MAAMVNMSNLLNGKDSRWLQLEVCREFQRNKCSRPDTECKFAHPPANVEVQNGRVTACYDSIKGRCQREKPPCKYFHPPQHLKDQLLINGRNHLALKNALMQQMGMAPPTPTPTIIPSPLQPMTANRFLPASNPYNPYFTTGALLPTAIIGPEHAATALASTTPIPQAVPLAAAAATTNNAVQPQKRTDRIQNTPTTTSSTTLPSSNGNITNTSVPLISSASILANLVESGKKRTAECLQMFPGILPYKRPAPDKPTTGIPAMYHQPSAAAYQQLIQLQSAQQSAAAAAYVPVSSHQNSINQSSPSSKAIIIPSNLENIKLAVATSNCTATAVAASDDGDDTENALSLQNTKNANVNGNGLDANVPIVSTSSNGNIANNSSSSSNSELVVEENNNKSINDMSNNGIDLSQQNNVADDVTNASTKASIVQSSIDESNLNAISFNSATSSSPAVVTTSAIYTTSSITTSNNNIHNINNNFSNNNSILSRKNSLTTPSQQLINGSNFSTNMSAKASYTNSGKVESVPDLLNPSSLNNPHLLSAAVFYNQPYQQLALAAAPSLYTDPAQFAKEMAQKNYANALKFAAVAQSQAGKTPNANSLSYSNPYSGVALSAAAGALPGTSNAAPRLPTPMASSTRAPFLPSAAAAAALTRPMQNPYQSHSFIRPQMQHVNLSNAAANPYIAAAAHQQFLNQQNFLYSGLTNPIASPQFTGVVTSNASSHATPTSFASSVTASYPFGAQSFQAAAAHGLPTSMMQMPQITSQSSQTGSTSAVVLNPYKKMKTS